MPESTKLSEKSTNLREVVERGVFRAMLGLPTSVQRALVGRPVVVDGQTLDTESQLMLRIQKVAREPAVDTLPMPQARKALLRQTKLVGGRQPIGETRDLEVPGGAGPIPARLYIPRAQVGSARTDWPLLFFVHGGGMMYGEIDSHDPLCRFLAERAEVRVLSIDYRLAPEHPYPAAVDDCWASFRWVSENSEELGADQDRIAVGGDSAGGYLSAVTAILAAEAGVPVRYQLLIYPVTNMADKSASRDLFGEGFLLTEAFMDLAEASYLSAAHDRRDPRVSIHYTEKIHANLAPAFVATAGFDPLRDEGEAYARLLSESGARVELKRYPGLVHGFACFVGVGRSSRAAVAEMAAKLKGAMH